MQIAIDQAEFDNMMLDLEDIWRAYPYLDETMEFDVEIRIVEHNLAGYASTYTNHYTLDGFTFATSCRWNLNGGETIYTIDTEILHKLEENCQ
jgi:hypothetical protein